MLQTGVVLKRSGYYTIPRPADLKLDPDGACNVEGFTIGREGYGNLYYPGTINIAGINFDEIVFFRFVFIKNVCSDNFNKIYFL